MRRRTFFKAGAAGALGAASLGVGPAPARAVATYHVATCEQYLNEIQTYSSADAVWDRALADWRFSPGTANNWHLLSDAKFRDTTAFGWIALVTASGGRVGIVDVTTANVAGLAGVLWSSNVRTVNATANPHAIERIPSNGSIVVADSDGWVHLYTPTAINDPGTLAWTVRYAFPGAHGVLWDPTSSLLWALGQGVLRYYAVTGTYRATRLALQGSIALPTSTLLGHDLQPDYSDTTHRRLLITHNSGVMSVDTTARTLSAVTFPGTGSANVKSFVRHTSGESLWVQATGLTYHGDTRNWVSPVVQFFDAANNKTFSRGLSYGAEFYKARFVTTAFD